MSTTTENNYVSNGSTVLYSFTFPYINEADVKVSLNQLDTTAFTLANATTVELDEAPVSGVSIRIYRSTPTDAVAAEFFPGSAIRAQDLNANFEQSLYVVQESQTIIENSDAASVVGIANEALATANQAKNTADSVSGIANDANTTAAEAETTANQALTDAATAQSTAVAARTIADAALSPASVLSDLSDVSDTPATTNQVLGWSGSTWGPVNQTGGGGGGTTINYNGASAWGYVNAGSLINGLNVDSSISNPATGVFDVSFTTAMPDANYSVVVTAGLEVVGNACNCSVGSKTVNGFQVNINKVSDNQGTNQSFQFAVFATNSLPPQGTTGTDAFGSWSNNTGTLTSSYNVASVTRNSTGDYDVVFATPMPSANYSVNVTAQSTTRKASVSTSSKSTTGFTILTVENGSSTKQDTSFDFTVHATNAQLPNTVTQEQIESAINNPGASAWALTDQQGVLLNGLNFSSITRTGGGEYDYVFATPMPSATYSIAGNVTNTVSSSSGFISFYNLTATGFSVKTRDSTGSLTNRDHSLVVFATNALPPKGGTGTDAFGSYTSNGTTLTTYNCSITRNGTGDHNVVFTTPMPTADYSVTASVSSGTNAILRVRSKSVNGFRITTGDVADSSSGLKDAGVDFQVNATNATLPSTFTEAQIQAVVDLAQNPQGIAKAWGVVAADGTLEESFNVARIDKMSVTDGTTDGIYRVVFTTPMNSNKYVVTGSTRSSAYYNFSISDTTQQTGEFVAYTTFISVTDSSVRYSDKSFTFAVFGN